jgi:hypothetical protein
LFLKPSFGSSNFWVICCVTRPCVVPSGRFIVFVTGYVGANFCLLKLGWRVSRLLCRRNEQNLCQVLQDCLPAGGAEMPRQGMSFLHSRKVMSDEWERNRNVDYRCEEGRFTMSASTRDHLKPRYALQENGGQFGDGYKKLRRTLFFWMSSISESHWWNLLHKEVKSWDFSTWFWWFWLEYFFERGSRCLINDINVASWLTKHFSVFPHEVYDSRTVPLSLFRPGTRAVSSAPSAEWR